MQQMFLLQILLLAQHVSGTTMPIVRSSRVLYSGYCLWYFYTIVCTPISKMAASEPAVYPTDPPRQERF